jgi:TRAP transporter TAXI family solute receptor
MSKRILMVVLVGFLLIPGLLAGGCAGGEEELVAQFVGVPTTGTAPLEVSFADQSTGDVTSWEWDFDNDGTVDSTSRNPTHTYSVAGTYSVSLTVTGPDGSDTETRSGYINVAEIGEIIAGFRASPTSGTAPLEVTFTDESAGDIEEWEWDFNNDGVVDSTEQNPTNTYTAGGVYTVSLTVTGPDGSDTEVKSSYISVEAGLPDMIGISTYGIGAATYTYSEFFAECIEDATGMQVKCVPIEEEFSRFAALIKGEVQYQWQPAGGWYNLSRGVGEYEPLGNTRVRVVWKGAAQYYTFAVRADSDIDEISDLAGKRVPWVASPTIQLSYECLLAYGGLTWDDVQKIPMPSYTAAMTALVEGSVDVSTATPSSSTMYELESSPHGLRWLSIDIEDQEAYARFKAVTPYYSSGLVDWGAGCSPENPVGMVGGPAIIGTIPGRASFATTYAVVQAIWEGYDCYSEKHEELTKYTHDIAVMVEDVPIPFDDALVQFLKDIGEWTEEREAIQAQLLADEEERCGLD